MDEYIRVPVTSLARQEQLRPKIAEMLKKDLTYRVIADFVGLTSGSISNYVNKSPELKALARARSKRKGGPRKKGVSRFTLNQ